MKMSSVLVRCVHDMFAAIPLALAG